MFGRFAILAAAVPLLAAVLAVDAGQAGLTAGQTRSATGFVAAQSPGNAHRQLAQRAGSGAALIDGASAFARMEAGELTLIDVRSPAEWRGTGVPRGARTVTIHDPAGLAGFVAAATRAVNGQKDRPIAVICARGTRSSRAQRALRAAGFSNIVNVREGMLGNPVDGPGWLRRNLPVETCPNC